jgi:hypothetical protein
MMRCKNKCVTVVYIPGLMLKPFDLYSDPMTRERLVFPYRAKLTLNQDESLTILRHHPCWVFESMET